MNIQNANLNRYRANHSPRANQAKPEASTLGYSDAKDVVLMTGAGALPGVGAVVNFMAMVGTGINNNNTLSMACLGGSVANIAGTATAAVGLFTGNSTATNVGLGLLGASALTAGIATASL